MMGTETAWRWILLSLSVGLTACAVRAQSRRYETMTAQLAREVAAHRASEARGKPPQVDEASTEVLDRARLVEAVLARNPTLTSARAAWRAALSEYPQARSLDDPMLQYQIAPLSVGSSDARFGQAVQISQRFSWPGKRALAGQVALAEAEAAREDYEATRHRLALMATLLFDQYYAIDRALAINDAHRRLLEGIAASARARYEAGQAAQGEPLKAELELAEIARQRITLTSRRGVLVAQLNGLLHRAPDERLPPPPAAIEPVLDEPPAAERLIAEALDHRPELAAAVARRRGRDVGIELSRRDYYPELGAMASYNTMWMDPQHRFMVGVSLNVPVQVGARRSAVAEARARHAQSDAELAALIDAIRVEIATARQQTTEALEVVRIYRERLLPTAEAQIEAARIGYEAGRSGFQSLIDAERSLRSLELDYELSLAELGERRAELDRAVGRLASEYEERDR